MRRSFGDSFVEKRVACQANSFLGLYDMGALERAKAITNKLNRARVRIKSIANKMNRAPERVWRSNEGSITN